ncbi:PDZ domain-containing protein [Undibacterium sp. LX40W]|uniref:PDZ domain-containing protein n=1 Tax=Undibacterium nitidum TaxID=2762298 RepID=A0A923HMR6_9BURK|nr:S41 family peptidase [Undibacterium nitidum]MBC3882244.1 PDZ domain-containing protein [Undibacterium nitidum]MBC3892525.1 PDZ domain-containing protein [Undibacterium sp. LX40W]
MLAQFLNFHRSVLLLVLCSGLFGCAAIDPQHVITRQFGNSAPADGRPLSPEIKQDAYNFVWNRVNEAYVDPQFNGVDWKHVGEIHYPKIMGAPNDALFWRNLDEMVAELGDAHTRVLSAKQYANDKERQILSLGLNIGDTNEGILVFGIAKDSAADQAKILVGDKIVEIDGVDAQQWWQQERQKARKNSTERAREKSVRRLLNGGDPERETSQVRLKIAAADGGLRELELTRGILPRKDSITSEIQDGNIGYIKLTAFDQKLNGQIAQHFEKLKETQALIVDLRGNGGGSLGMALNMMDHVVSGKVAIGERKTRTGKPPTFMFGLISAGSLKLELKGVSQPYLKPLIVLVDSDSASASEFLSGSLQAIGRAQVFGSTSCGCLLGYMGYANIPGGGALAYSEMDFVPIAGKRIEGNGVLPDRLLMISRADLIAKRDVVLEAALDTLKQRLHTAAASENEAARVVKSSQ